MAAMAQGSSQPHQPAVSVPPHPTDVILGRPADTSVVLSILRCDSDITATVAYGTKSDQPSNRTEALQCRKDQVREVVLDKLKPDTLYYYRLNDTSTDRALAEGSFHTQRPHGSSFTFTITADSHLDQNTDLSLYQRTLANALADSPDFHIDLGDTFMTEKHESRQNAAGQYLAQRFYFGQLCRSAPLFLVVGNHDGEEAKLARGGGRLDVGGESVAVWANTTRTRYFPNPIPDSFYTGNTKTQSQTAHLQDYYAWEWGDALFVVLDPYWSSSARRADDRWGLSLGSVQHAWLKKTLESSKARYKFIFIHQLIGGLDEQGRGGIEAASFGEWGGKNADGTDGFKDHRPAKDGWDMPIHQLLVRNQVSAVFHGHDHLFARQELDGVIYQEVPQPGAVSRRQDSASEYGYRSGVILTSSGHMRITVTPQRITADYVRARLPRDERTGDSNRQVAYSYTIGDTISPLTTAPAPPPPPARADRRNRPPRRDNPDPSVPAEAAALKSLSCILGRPTDSSMTISICAAERLEAYIDYGLASGNYPQKTPAMTLSAGEPADVWLGKLPPDKQCFYQLRYRKPSEQAFRSGEERSFHTQRAPGSPFVFEIQGDSHPERPQMFDSALYVQTLRAAAADHPDFYMLIGDDFSVDTLRSINAQTVTGRYTLQRPFLALVGQSSPLFLVNGNHEQAAAYNLDGTPNNVAVWAQNARNLYFPQPAPDAFYTGDAKPVEQIGLLRDFYTWTWGDALFVVIDPYWHSSQPVDNTLSGDPKGSRDLWNVTLGDDQYQWLKKTLQTSKARYKFVFAHHVMGTGRGGIEEAGLYEWGGNNRRGVNEFPTKRPGWDLPIHQLMARTGVSIFFQGHDHIFAHQQLDGVVYQTLPVPADTNYSFYNKESYRSGDILPGAGRVRVTVSPQFVRVEYLRSYLPNDATVQHPDGEVAFSYEISAPGAHK